MRGIRKQLHSVSAAAFFLALSGGKAFAMDILACKVTIEADQSESPDAKLYCQTVAEQLGARLVSETEMRSMLASGAREAGEGIYHLLDARIVSLHAIAVDYAFGSAGEWRDGRESRQPNLRLSVMDSGIGQASFAQIGRTLKHLSAR